MIVPSTPHLPGGAVEWSIFMESGEDCMLVGGAKVCVALWPPSPLAADGYVWLKTWSNCEGIEEALVAAGVVTLTDAVEPTGYSFARLAKLTDAAVAARDAVLAGNLGMSTARQGARAVAFTQRPALQA